MFKRNLQILLIVFCFTAFKSLPVYAYSLLASHCNDNQFGSDGGGVAGCFEVVADYGQIKYGLGMFGVTDEKKAAKRDPSDQLEDLVRLNFWVSTVTEKQQYTFAVTPRLGLEGGWVDDVGFELQEALHSALGIGQREVESTHDLRFLYGVSGWLRTDFYEKELEDNVVFKVEPYLFGSLGNDTVEAGAGTMFSLQSSQSRKDLPLFLPKNGSYLPEMGGSGVALYLSGRGVAHESFYDEEREPWLAEVGGLAQAKVYNAFRVGVGASCTNKPYDTALSSDCKADYRISYDFDEKLTAFDFASDLRDDRELYHRDDSYSLTKFSDHLYSIRWGVAGLVGTIAALGVDSWDWGSSSFNNNSEGFFGNDTGSYGMDKLGHAYASYLIAENITSHIRRKASDPEDAIISSALLTYGLMTYVEVFDGFSADHGFSYEDMIFNAGGVALSTVRNMFPSLYEKIDFRLEYIPTTDTDGFHPITDYSGQKYLLALKASGFSATKDTFLKYFEFQAGYFARGFTKDEKKRGEDKRREPYVAISLNLQELLFGSEKIRNTKIGQDARRFLEYYQVPYTYVATENDY